MMNIVNVNTSTKTMHIEQYEGDGLEVAEYEWVSTHFTNERIIIKGLFKTSKKPFSLSLPSMFTNYMEY